MATISQTTFWNAFSWMKMSKFRLRFHWSAVKNIPALVQIMAWRRPGDKPLSEPMMVRMPTRICVTRPQWVNTMLLHSNTWNYNAILTQFHRNLHPELSFSQLPLQLVIGITYEWRHFNLSQVTMVMVIILTVFCGTSRYVLSGDTSYRSVPHVCSPRLLLKRAERLRLICWPRPLV